MQVTLLKSKLLRAEVTDRALHYEGSLAIDSALMEQIGLLPYEKILVANIANGERLETYVIKGERDKGEICLNGPAARKVQKGDTIIIISYAILDFEEAKSFSPTLIFPNPDNTL